MSRDKRKARNRQQILLDDIKRRGRIWLNCEGGMAADNPELSALVARGLVRIRRTGGVPKWSKKFLKRPSHFHGRFSEGFIRRSFAEPV